MNSCFIRHIIPKAIKFDQDMPPLKQQQLFEHNLNVCKYKLDHLRSKAKLKKTFRNLNESGCTQLAKRSSRKNVIRSGKIFREVQLQDLRSITKERAVVTILQIEGSFRTRVSAKNMALGESKSDKGPTRSSFERLLFKISQGSRGHLVEMKNHRCPFCRHLG